MADKLYDLAKVALLQCRGPLKGVPIALKQISISDVSQLQCRGPLKGVPILEEFDPEKLWLVASMQRTPQGGPDLGSSSVRYPS